MDPMKLDARPDVPVALTAALNALIEAHQTGTLKGIAIAGHLARLDPETSDVGLRPLTALWAGNAMCGRLTRDEMLLLDEAPLDEVAEQVGQQ